MALRKELIFGMVVDYLAIAIVEPLKLCYVGCWMLTISPHSDSDW